MTDNEIESYFKKRKTVPTYFSKNLGKHQLHWVKTGKEELPILLLIHGAPGAWYGYINLISDSILQKNFTIISVDRPGYNNSKKGGKVLSISLQGELISTVFRTDTNRAVYILGRSYGAPIAAYLAARFPKQVKGLMLVSPAAHPDLEKFWWFSPLVQYPPLRWVFPAPIKTASSEKFAHRSELNSILPCWAEVKCPTYILQGGKDFILKPGNACFVDSVMTSAPRLHRYLPENGHLITAENPNLVIHMTIDLKKGVLN